MGARARRCRVACWPASCRRLLARRPLRRLLARRPLRLLLHPQAGRARACRQAYAVGDVRQQPKEWQEGRGLDAGGDEEGALEAEALDQEAPQRRAAAPAVVRASGRREGQAWRVWVDGGSAAAAAEGSRWAASQECWARLRGIVLLSPQPQPSPSPHLNVRTESTAFTLPRYCRGTKSIRTERIRGRVALATAMRARCTPTSRPCTEAGAVGRYASVTSSPMSRERVRRLQHGG